mmetsp:Transcript_469/g.716  ORF Transcript_469/g.716 Transcript_469/m.716 type:complete len:89 (+) Transcript_469:186-452(+)
MNQCDCFKKIAARQSKTFPLPIVPNLLKSQNTTILHQINLTRCSEQPRPFAQPSQQLPRCPCGNIARSFATCSRRVTKTLRKARSFIT